MIRVDRVKMGSKLNNVPRANWQIYGIMLPTDEQYILNIPAELVTRTNMRQLVIDNVDMLLNGAIYTKLNFSKRTANDKTMIKFDQATNMYILKGGVSDAVTDTDE
jgi:hypothetical protein